jgi:heat shock protein HtpX
MIGTLDQRMRISLRWRMATALVVLAVVTVPIVLTAVLVAGIVGLLVTFLLGVVASMFLVPVTEPMAPARVIWRVRLPITVFAGAVLMPVLYLGPVRTQIEQFRHDLGTSGVPLEQEYPALVRVSDRLAQRADIPAPDLFLSERDRPASYTVGSRSDGTIILTRGLCRALSDAELEAVLAHELSHLHNGDSRIMGVALVPTLLADRVGASGPPEIDWFVRQPLVFVGRYVAWLLVAALTAVQRLCGQFGVGFLSRSREFAADRGAAKLTGSPAILASALETLSDARSRPAEDLRSWQQSATALDILPVERADGWTGTHPDTETRIRRLEAMAAEQEVSGDAV